ncbi:hypothetical protein SAY87_006450 [Trapa incisa]|uniref:Uncharacterized protein n=1 Tax=Trapa incisa TaxID=236973 RepID=A0AAN7K2Q5_9MYRT|nr:hypothetical protein SAY87_006450 [Trapa incisa]
MSKFTISDQVKTKLAIKSKAKGGSKQDMEFSAKNRKKKKLFAESIPVVLFYVRRRSTGCSGFEPFIFFFGSGPQLSEAHLLMLQLNRLKEKFMDHMKMGTSKPR